MTDSSKRQGVIKTVANDRHVEGGYQPRAQGPVRRENLKPPKGGSAVEPPKTKDSAPPQA